MTTTLIVPDNPDTRPLPEGWVQEYDQRRQRWFYRQPSATPPRTSYAHPLGALKPTVAIQRTAPILNVRGQSQLAPQSPVPSPVPGLSNAQQLYKNLSTPVTPIAPHGGAASSMPNLPPHMRRILTVPGEASLPTPISPPSLAPLGGYSPSSPPTIAPTAVPSRLFSTELRTSPSSSPSDYLNHPLPPLPPPTSHTNKSSSHRRFSTSDEPVRSTARPISVQQFVVRRQARSQSVSNQVLPFIRPPEGRNNPRPQYQPTSFDPVPQVPIDLFAEPSGRSLLPHHSRGTSADPPRTKTTYPNYGNPTYPPSRLPTPRLSLPITSHQHPQQSAQPQHPARSQTHSESSPSPDYQPPTSDPPASAFMHPRPHQQTNISQASSQDPSPSSSRPSLVDVGVQASPDQDYSYTYDAESSKGDGDVSEPSGAGYEPVSAMDGGVDLEELPTSGPSEGVGFNFNSDVGAAPGSIPMDVIQSGLAALGLGEDGTTFEPWTTMMGQMPGLRGGLSEDGYGGSEAPRYGTSEGAPPYDPGF